MASAPTPPPFRHASFTVLDGVVVTIEAGEQATERPASPVVSEASQPPGDRYRDPADLREASAEFGRPSIELKQHQRQKCAQLPGIVARAAVGLEVHEQHDQDDVDQRKDSVAGLIVGTHVDGCSHHGTSAARTSICAMLHQNTAVRSGPYTTLHTRPSSD